MVLCVSEALVRFIAEKCNISDTDLGVKDKTGILKSMESRASFLSDKSHAIRIVYTPKHSSWLNQIEMWFGIITRRFLNKRASFKSVEDLENGIQIFIKFYNDHMAKPFKWTYEGKLLRI
ncbi:MAG: hypothetical protein BWY74_00943 [Firmicutes bacterium ADurb.Bin419]|nr:MAG: hypothetical protein BWY74_00943 [Firmicutes bacterium ADurb.Bin419]